MVVQHFHHNIQGKVSIHIVIHQHYPQILKKIKRKVSTKITGNILTNFKITKDVKQNPGKIHQSPLKR
jgi:hypothetical protein